MLFKFALSSDCKVRESFELHKRVVSSAYITHLQDTQSTSELTKIINNNGPRIEPWGTPMSIHFESESEELILTT